MQNKSFVIVAIRLNDDDTPVRDPEEVAREIVELGLRGVAEARPAFSDGEGRWWPYGPSIFGP